MLKAIKRWFRPKATPTVRDGGRIKVYHEYFVAPEPVDDRWPWHGRVYVTGGDVVEQHGVERSEGGARAAAIAWCQRTKKELAP